MSKDSKGGKSDKPQRVVPEHRGVAKKPGNGGAREGAGRKERRRGGYKTRNWVTVLYPESAAEGWKDILRGWCCQALLSPLHDKDKDPTGEAKKPHYHLLVMFDGPRSQSLMEEQFKTLGGVGCQACNSARGYARYLCHMDNPEKYQYPVEQVEAFGGANYLDIIALESDRRATIAEMCDWCDAEGCISFAELCREARKNHPTWWQAITSNSTMIMFRYIRSLEDEMDKGRFRKPVPPTVVEMETPLGVKQVEVATGAIVEPVSPLEAARQEAARVRARLAELIGTIDAMEKAGLGKEGGGDDGATS